MYKSIILAALLIAAANANSQDCSYPITWGFPNPDSGQVCGSWLYFDSPQLPTPATIEFYADGVLIESIVRYSYTGAYTLQNVPAGVAEIITTDANCCIRTVSSAPYELTGTLSGNSPMIFDLIGTSTWVLTSGGIPYSFEWSTGSTISLIPPVENINMSVTVTNLDGCTHVEPLIDRRCCILELPIEYFQTLDGVTNCESMKYFLKQYPPFDQGTTVYVTDADGEVVHSDYWDSANWGGYKGTSPVLCENGPYYWYVYVEEDDCWYWQEI